MFVWVRKRDQSDCLIMMKRLREIATAFISYYYTPKVYNVKNKYNENMSAFRPIFNTIFQYSIDDDALELFFKSAWNNYQHNQKREQGESYITVKPINSRSELGKKRFAELYADAEDIEFVEL